MELNNQINISDCFKLLYAEFMTKLVENGSVRRTIQINLKNEPSVCLSIFSDIETVIKEFQELDNYNRLTELINNDQRTKNKPVEINAYGLIAYIFSDLYNHLSAIETGYRINKKLNITDIYFNEDSLIKAISNAVRPQSFYDERDRFILIFENIKIEENFEINKDLKFINLTKEDVNEKFDWQVNNSKRVFSAIEISSELLNVDSIEAILGSLFRLYKNGDFKFNGIFREANHFISGKIYVSKNNVSTENDYREHTPNVQHDAWRDYQIKNTETSDFSKFITKYISSMSPMAHSCQMYNMVNSSPLQLKIPLLFFVIESFFSDVQSEVSFRVPLYVTNLLDEDDSFRKTLKKLYDVRSKVAHGDLVGAKKIIGKMHSSGELNLNGFLGASEHLDLIVKRLWIKLLDIEWNPAKSDNLIANYLLRKKDGANSTPNE